KGRPAAPLFKKDWEASLRGRARRLCRRPRRGGGGRGVLELLLGTEQRVEHLLAQTLGESERSARADQEQDHPAAPAAPLLCLRAAERIGSLAQRRRGLPQLALGLL